MSQFRVQEEHLAGFSVMTDQVDAHVASVMTFIRAHGGAHAGDWSGLMSLLKGPVNSYSDAANDRLLDVGIALRSMGTELNRAAWVYHGVDREAYERIEVLAGKKYAAGAKAYSGSRVGYAPGAAPSLTAPEIGEADIKAQLDEVGGVLNGFDDVISFVTGWSPVSALIKPLSGNWNALTAAGESLISAGDSAERIGTDLGGSVAKLGAHWDGAAASSFDGYADRVVTGLRAEAPLTRTVGRAYIQVAKQVETITATVVDRLGWVCDELAKRASTSWIPGYGQYKAIKFLKECVGLFNDLKAMVDQIEDTITTIRGVIDAASHPLDYLQGRIQDKLQPVIDKINSTTNDVRVTRDLVSIDPVKLKNVPGGLYHLGKHPQANG